MSIEYDENVLQRFVDGLYSQARQIIFGCALQYGIIGAAVGFLIAIGISIAGKTNPALSTDFSSLAWGCTLVVGFLGMAYGISIGRERAFELKIRAQQLLLQMEIERNTRSPARAARM